jgi:hypothetical protein
MPYSRKLFLSGATCSKRIHLLHAGSGGGSVIAKIGKPQGFRVYCNTLALLASLILSCRLFAAFNPVRGVLEVVWEPSVFVSVCPVDLLLPEIFGFAQVGPSQVGIVQFGPAEVGADQIGPDQVGRVQFGLAQVGPVQVSMDQVGFAQVGIS